MSVTQKIDKLIEEAKAPKGFSPEDRVKAAGKDFVYTSNPDENILSMFHPIKADAVSADDLAHRAKVLGIDPDVLEKNMSIRDSESSGYAVDTPKLSGYASRMYPDEVTFGNTMGSGKHVAASTGPGAILGAGLGVKFNMEDPAEGAAIGAGVGMLAGGALGAAGKWIGHKQGQALYDRLNKK